jgi:hypothetical protein
MFRFAAYAFIALASLAPAQAGTFVAPAVGSPVPVAVAIGAVALALRLFRRR